MQGKLLKVAKKIRHNLWQDLNFSCRDSPPLIIPKDCPSINVCEISSKTLSHFYWVKVEFILTKMLFVMNPVGEYYGALIEITLSNTEKNDQRLFGRVIIL